MSGPAAVTLALTVLGCSGSYAGPGGACSGYLVQSDGVSVWLDAGPGTLANLQLHLDLDDLDAVVLTHAHPDHWVDVLPYHNAIRYLRPRTGLPVFSPPEVRRLAREVNGGLEPALHWTDVHGGSTVTVGALSLSFSRTDHGPETLAVRVGDASGASLGYSADTGPGWSLSELGPDLGLALCEASLAPEQERRVQHLTAAQAGTSARAAGARRLVITHLQPGVDPDRSRDDASAAFGLPVDLAADHARYEVHR
ncbi:MAG: MBL fold metallo-hydrolase [Actinobacteria bacterium]|nr:MBL fold metallo-hydrolase [Actinomycetota bacterium]MBW3642573.1 MBL fold metallo-hydrolase [Actinomycetota bacterium]